MKITFEISDKAYDLLKQIGQGGAEYRDSEWETLEDFKNSDEFKSGLRTEDWFMNRNYDGTYYLIPELRKYNLVDMDYMSWHSTYILTDFGKKIIYGQ